MHCSFKLKLDLIIWTFDWIQLHNANSFLQRMNISLFVNITLIARVFVTIVCASCYFLFLRCAHLIRTCFTFSPGERTISFALFNHYQKIFTNAVLNCRLNAIMLTRSFLIYMLIDLTTRPESFYSLFISLFRLARFPVVKTINIRQEMFLFFVRYCFAIERKSIVRSLHVLAMSSPFFPIQTSL